MGIPPTHEVTDQPPPLVGHDVHTGDLTLAGTAEAQRWATEANAYPPVLRTHDRWGARLGSPVLGEPALVDRAAPTR